jgi:arsenical pump membrane protein
LLIALGSILCMLIRPRGVPEAYWVSAGALLLVVLRLLPLHQAGHAVREGFDVYLFLIGMMILAELARQEGVFDWVADIAARRAKGSPSRLFVLVYLAGTVITTLLSNDATAVVLTPAVLAVVRKAKLPAKPFVLACALIANAASFVLPISNPANLVIFGTRMPPLAEWLRIFALPSLASILITFVVLRFLSRPDLDGRIEDLGPRSTLSAQGQMALIGLLVSCVALITASLLGIDLGAPTCAAALIALFLVAWRDPAVIRKVLRSVSWSIVPLVAGLFVIVEALEGAGLLRFGQQALQALATWPRILGDLSAAFGVGLLSNGVNNLPVGLMSAKALQAAHQSASLAHSVLIGVDLGPNLSVTGSLATILWLIALRREQIEVTAWQFFKVGVLAMPVALIASVLLLRP